MKKKVVVFLTRDAIEKSRVIRVRAENKLIIGVPLGTEFKKRRGCFCLDMKIGEFKFGVPCPRIAEIQEDERQSNGERQIIEAAA